MSAQGPFMSKLTQWLGIRRHRMWLRYKDDLSTRSIPKPNMPPSENSAISNNYYYSRDARREMAPPVVIMRAGTEQKKLEEGKMEDTKPPAVAESFPTPGVGPRWTLSKEQGL